MAMKNNVDINAFYFDAIWSFQMQTCGSIKMIMSDAKLMQAATTVSFRKSTGQEPSVVKIFHTFSIEWHLKISTKTSVI